MKRENIWNSYSQDDLDKLEKLACDYIDFISDNKTERECATAAIALAEAKGYFPLEQAIEAGRALKCGDKVWAHTHGKALLLVHVGSEPLERGFNILGAHIDSPRLDLKQNPLYEADGFTLLDTHYYGGIKKYQWVTIPLALHGVVVTADGTIVPVTVGEDPNDPVFCITDLLPHLGQEQMKKTASKFIDGEVLDVLVGSRPLALETDEGDEKADDEKAEWERLHEKEPVKAFMLKLLSDKYGIVEDDLVSAEIEVVPAGRARHMGSDRSMVLGYGQDDRVCAYTSLVAQLSLERVERTAMTILVDKEEIGSVGATGMESLFFENAVAEIMELAGEGGSLAMRRALARSKMLSSDVSAGFDPGYASVFEKKNAAFLGKGLVFNKYTGARGKSGSNDTSAEFVARVRRVMDDAHVAYQTAELGKVDIGGGGTIAYIPAKYDMDVIDSGVSVLSMHAPWEVSSKADIYEACKGYKAFLLNA